MAKTPKKTLFENRWVRVNELQHEMPDGSTMPYTSIQGGNGHTIAILPFRHSENIGIEFLLRAEITPPWVIDSDDPSELVLSSLTGMVDDGETPLEAATRELYEESGYRVEPEQLLDIGTLRAAKMLEGVFHLYAVNVSGLQAEEAPGDGGGFEEHALSVWVQQPQDSPDAMAWAMLARMHFLGIIRPIRVEEARGDEDLAAIGYPVRDDFCLMTLSAVKDPPDRLTRIDPEHRAPLGYGEDDHEA